MTKTVRLAIGSLVVGIAVLGLKAIAYWLTGSVALMSDALESIVNVATAVVALIAEGLITLLENRLLKWRPAQFG